MHRYVDGASLEGEVVRERIQIGPFYGNLTFGLVNDTSGTPSSSRVASLIGRCCLHGRRLAAWRHPRPGFWQIAL